MTVAKVRAETFVAYDEDVLLWSQQQARLLREGRFAELDIEHLVDEIEDVGKSEKRELASRCAILIAHLLKWVAQPQLRSNSWRQTIVVQRKRIALAVKATPSLKTAMRDVDWREDLWLDARSQAAAQTGLDDDMLPKSAFTLEQGCETDFWPE